METGQTNVVAMAGFAIFIVLSLVITWWAARKTRSTEHFYAAGRSITGFQNGLALAGDYMSAASFLGIAGLVATAGFDGLIYSIGFLVGWPVVVCLIAEPIRNLGKFTFSDVVAFRLRQVPVRIASAFGSLAVVAFYLIAQMVGAGNLIKLLFGLNYEVAVIIVGLVMLAYVLFGGMIATTWVQIVKAVLLLTGAFMLAVLVLLQFSFNPLALFQEAARQYGDGVLAPGRFVTNPIDGISLGLALMFGTAGLPHILMRFYTVPDARTARVSVAYATAAIGGFYLLTFILGFGAMVIVGQPAIRAVDVAGNMAGVPRVHLGSGVCDNSRRRRRPDAGGRGGAVPRHLRARVPRRPRQREGRAEGRPRRDHRPGAAGDRPGHRLQGPECRLHGRARVRDRGQRQLPRPGAVDLLAPVHDPRRAGVDPGRHAVGADADLPLPDHPNRCPETFDSGFSV
jgi:hypothetical protein